MMVQMHKDMGGLGSLTLRPSRPVAGISVLLNEVTSLEEEK